MRPFTASWEVYSSQLIDVPAALTWLDLRSGLSRPLMLILERTARLGSLKMSAVFYGTPKFY